MTTPKSRPELRAIGLCGQAWPGTNGFIRCYEPIGHGSPHQPNAEGQRFLEERKSKYRALVARA